MVTYGELKKELGRIEIRYSYAKDYRPAIKAHSVEERSVIASLVAYILKQIEVRTDDDSVTKEVEIGGLESIMEHLGLSSNMARKVVIGFRSLNAEVSTNLRGFRGFNFSYS